MYVVREIMQCKPGKVREMVKRFTSLSQLVQKMGYKPFRIYTDVSGERFWTIVGETEVDSVDQFFVMMEKSMESEEVRRLMTGYHDVVESGRREIYKLEN